MTVGLAQAVAAPSRVPAEREPRDAHGKFLRLAFERLREQVRRAEQGEQGDLEIPTFPSAHVPAAVVLAERLRLTTFEAWVLWLAAAMDLDQPLAETAKRCGGLRADLCLHWLPGAHADAFSPEGLLRRFHLLQPSSVERGPLVVPERVRHYLLGLACQEPRLAPYTLNHARPSRPSAVLAGRVARVESWVNGEAGKGLALVLTAEPQADLASCLHHAAAAHGHRLVRLDPAIVQQEREALWQTVNLLQREALLERVIFFLEPPSHPPAGFWDQVGPFLNRAGDVVALLSSAPVDLAPGDHHAIAFEPLTRAEQAALWREGLPAEADDAAIEEVASTFRLAPGRIQAVQVDLSSKPVTRDALWEACRLAARPRSVPGVEAVVPRARAEDLVLPEPQREALRTLRAQVRHRLKVFESWGFGARSARGLGLSALFSGPSGTGKSMAAEVIAGELGLDLYVVDLSRVVSKYVGETEKNLAALFDAAETSGAVLLFDEADALFGKRSEVKDAHDRYANIEVSYLLQKMDGYAGLSILTSNLKQSIDEAFLRRIRMSVAFPFPDAVHRRRIWERAFPADAPRDGLDYDRLAQLNVAGGNIRNIALCAAFTAAEEGAAIGMRHLLQAARWEYQKLEKPLTDRELRGWPRT